MIFSWALYDLADQFFAINIVSLYFVRWVTIEKNAPEIFYSLAFGLSMFLVAVLAPIFGEISDITGRRKPPLVYLSALCILSTIALSRVDGILPGLFFFVIANFGCQTAVVFYNALLINVANNERVGLVSGFGRMFGYIGAILAMYIVRPLVLRDGYQAAFLPTALLFLVFSIPCLIFVKDQKNERQIKFSSALNKEKVFSIFKKIKQDFSDALKIRGLSDFFKASFFGLCAVNVILLYISLYVTRVFGLDEIEITNLLVFSTLFAIGGSFFSGFLSDYIGFKKSLFIIFILWIICIFSGALVRDKNLFHFIGAMVGATLGATWTVMRAAAIKLVPQGRIGETFGLFSLLGYASSIVGSFYWGAALLLFPPMEEFSYRMAILSLEIFLVLALIFVSRLPGPIKILKN